MGYGRFPAADACSSATGLFGSGRRFFVLFSPFLVASDAAFGNHHISSISPIMRVHFLQTTRFSNRLAGRHWERGRRGRGGFINAAWSARFAGRVFPFYFRRSRQSGVVTVWVRRVSIVCTTSGEVVGPSLLGRACGNAVPRFQCHSTLGFPVHAGPCVLAIRCDPYLSTLGVSPPSFRRRFRGGGPPARPRCAPM